MESVGWSIGFEPEEIDSETESRYLAMAPEERIGHIWPLTKEAWFKKTGIWLED